MRANRLVKLITGTPDQFSLERRLENAGYFFATLIGFFCCISNLVVGLPHKITLITFALSLGVFGIYLTSRLLIPRSRLRLAEGVLLSFWLFVCGSLGALWFINGGLDGPIVYMLLFTLYFAITVTAQPRRRQVITVVISVEIVVLMATEYFYPAWVVGYESRALLFADNIGALICGMLGFVCWAFIVRETYDMQQLESEQKSEQLSDLVRRLRAEREKFKTKQAHLEALNEEKGTLVSMAAHDLRSPLNRVEGLSEVVKVSGPLTDDQQRYLGEMRHIVEEGRHLIDNLLKLEDAEQRRLPTVVRQPLDVCALVYRVLDGYAPTLARKELRAYCCTPAAELPIVSNEEHLTRILENLFSNAVKFSPPRRKVYLTLALTEKAVQISLRDEGPGIPPDELPLLFGRFKRLSPRPTAGESSSGLGLFIVRELVMQLKGSVSVSSNLGAGTTFVVDIPTVSETVSGPPALAST